MLSPDTLPLVRTGKPGRPSVDWAALARKAKFQPVEVEYSSPGVAASRASQVRPIAALLVAQMGVTDVKVSVNGSVLRIAVKR